MNSKKNKQRGRAEFSNNTRGKFNNDQEKSKDALLKKTSQKYEEKHGNTVMNSKKSKHWSKTVFSDNTSDKVNDQEETNVELLLKSLQEHREEVSFLKEENKKLQDELHKFTTLCKCQSKEKIKEEPSQIDDYGTKIPPSCSSYYSTDAQYKQGSQGDISSASGLKENTWEDDYDLMNLQPSCSSYHSTDAHLYQQGSQGNNTSTNDLEENTWERNFHPSTNSRKYYSKGYSKSSDREEKLSRNKERSSEFRRGNESSCYQIKEMEGDLFTAPNDYSLAHCVAEDLQMGSGIAVQFKRDFKNVEELLCQKKKVGQVAVLQSGERFIYYLITKRFSVGKPIFDDLRKALVNMRKHMEENQVKKLAIPRLGCGLDRLKWKEVRATLQEIFRETEIEIVVYTFMQGFGKNNPVSLSDLEETKTGDEVTKKRKRKQRNSKENRTKK